MTNDFPHEIAIKDSELQAVRELQVYRDKMIEKLSNPTGRMMLAGALAHNAGLRPMRAAITAGEAKNIFVAMIAVLNESE